METIKTKITDKLKDTLLWVGTIGATITSIAYIILVVILILGFKAQLGFNSIIVYAVTNAVFGLVILFFLKVQGQTLAMSEEESKAVKKKYNDLLGKNKEAKPRSITHYWLTSTIKDVAFKSLSVLISTFGVLSIIVKGNGDWSLMLMAIVSLMMFVSFGLLSLVNTYDYYKYQHLAYLKQKINLMENSNDNSK